MEQHEPDQDNGISIALNDALVDDLKKRKCIQTPNVEAAFRAVLRHHFLPGTPWETVYSDLAISAKQDQEGRWLSSSSQPTIMGIMLEQLGLEPEGLRVCALRRRDRDREAMDEAHHGIAHPGFAFNQQGR